MSQSSLRFSVCDNCVHPVAHGHFWYEGKKCPEGTPSLQMAREVIAAFLTNGAITEEEAAIVRSDVAASGLPERYDPGIPSEN